MEPLVQSDSQPQLNPQSLMSERDRQRAVQSAQVQQAAQQFPSRLAQELDLASHVPQMPTGEQMAAARDAQWYAQVAKTSPQWAAKLLAERDARRAAFQQFNQRLQGLFGGQQQPAGIPGINGQIVPNPNPGHNMLPPIIGVRG